MPEKTKKTLYMEQKAADLLQEMGNASEYVSGLLIRHEREWQGAWQDLANAGWIRAEVDVAVRVLFERSLVNDLWWNNHAAVAGVLSSSEEEALQVGVEPARWAVIVQAATEREIANHLLVLSREYALGNDRARSRIQNPVRVRWGRRGEGQEIQVTIDSDVPHADEVMSRLSSLSRSSADFTLVHGPYTREDGSMFVSLALVAPTSDRGAVLALVRRVLRVRDLGWHQ